AELRSPRSGGPGAASGPGGPDPDSAGGPPGGRGEHLGGGFLRPGGPGGGRAAAGAAYGHGDGVLCNHARSSEGDLAEVTAAELDASFAVNTRAVLLPVKAFPPRHHGAPGG